jgi:exosome complex component RRP41
MSDKPEKLITDDGLRLDGRRADEIRPMKIEIGVLSRADGSCYLEWGKNKILVGVFGPREAHPRRMQRADAAVIRYKYNMASFSVEDRARPGPSRRSIEISKVSREAFEPVIMAELFPKTAIDIFVEVLQADAGTRTAALNASSVALADAGIPMKGLITSCAFGKVDGEIVLDLNKDEDNYGEADFPVAMTQDGEITLLQMDGHLTPDEIKKGMELVKKGCKEILEIQQAVLRKKFETPIEDAVEEAVEDTEAAEEAAEDTEATEEAVEDTGEAVEDTGEAVEDTEEAVEDTEAADNLDIENKVIEAEAALDYASEAAVVEEAIEEAEEFEEGQLSEETIETEAVTEEFPEYEELQEIINEAEAVAGENTLEEVIEAEIEEEALEEEAEFEASFEAGPEPEELQEIEPSTKETISDEAEEVKLESEELTDEEPQLEEETEKEEVAPEETSEAELKLESGKKIKKEIPAEAAVKAEEEPVEEKCEGPWKVVKDPSESGNRGENND